jgi:hypothetical protein
MAKLAGVPKLFGRELLEFDRCEMYPAVVIVAKITTTQTIPANAEEMKRGPFALQLMHALKLDFGSVRR